MLSAARDTGHGRLIFLFFFKKKRVLTHQAIGTRVPGPWSQVPGPDPKKNWETGSLYFFDFGFEAGLRFGAFDLEAFVFDAEAFDAGFFAALRLGVVFFAADAFFDFVADAFFDFVADAFFDFVADAFLADAFFDDAFLAEVFDFLALRFGADAFELFDPFAPFFGVAFEPFEADFFDFFDPLDAGAFFDADLGFEPLDTDLALDFFEPLDAGRLAALAALETFDTDLALETFDADLALETFDADLAFFDFFDFLEAVELFLGDVLSDLAITSYLNVA
jgi:hypothetical protein